MAIGGNTADSLSTTTKFTLGAAASAATGKAGATVIGPEAAIRGDVKSKGDVVIAGAVEGEVSSDAKVVIAQGGTVSGRVAATEVVIEGRLVGDSAARSDLYRSLQHDGAIGIRIGIRRCKVSLPGRSLTRVPGGSSRRLANRCPGIDLIFQISDPSTI
jgi:cytoskeletal protein CcmA (bactofilin family)